MDYSITALSLQIGSTETERRLVWLQPEGFSGARVEVMTAADYDRLGGFTGAEVRSFTGTVTPVRMRGPLLSCKVRISALCEGESYVYRVGCNEAWDTEVYRFTVPTVTGGTQSFFMISDLHNNIYRRKPDDDGSRARARIASILEAGASYGDGAAFLLSIGDNASVANMPASFYPNPEEYSQRRAADYTFAEHCELHATPLLRTLPFASVLGNHDAIHITDGEDVGDINNVLYDMPNDDGHAGHYLDHSSGDFYFTSGNLLVVGINAMVNPTGNTTPCAPEVHRAFIEKAIASAPEAAWRILLCHVPAYAYIGGAPLNSKGQPTERARMESFFGKTLCDPFGFDIVFTGHQHAFSRTYPLCGGYVGGWADRRVTHSDEGYPTEHIVDPEGTVHYNVPAALDHSFVSGLPASPHDLYPAYGVKDGYLEEAKQNAVPEIDKFEGVTYRSPTFVHVTLREEEGGRTMTVKAVRSDTAAAFDTLVIEKTK